MLDCIFYIYSLQFFIAMQRLARSQHSDYVGVLFRKIIMLLAIVLVSLPFWFPLQNSAIHLLFHQGWYKQFHAPVVASELHAVITLLTFFGLHSHVSTAYLVWTPASRSTNTLHITWDAVCWQCFLLFFLTAYTALVRKHTLLLKLLTLLVGSLGTYLFTMLWLIIVLLTNIDFRRPLEVVLLEYVTLILFFGFLARFWSFAYRSPILRVAAENQPRKKE